VHVQLVPQGNGDLLRLLEQNQNSSQPIHILRRLTFTSLQRSNGQEQQIHCVLVLLNRLTDFIDTADQTGVLAHKGKFAIWIQSFAFVDDTSARFFRATDQIDARRKRVSRELSDRGLADSICCSDEYSHESRRKGGCDLPIRGANCFESHHDDECRRVLRIPRSFGPMTRRIYMSWHAWATMIRWSPEHLNDRPSGTSVEAETSFCCRRAKLYA
jgi:hypothetical protein